MMGNRHPLRAAKIGQITRGGGYVGEWRWGPFTLSLPIRVLKVVASPHNLALSDYCQAQLSVSSGAENKIKVIDMFLPALHVRETT